MDTRVCSVLRIPFGSFRTEVVDHSASGDGYGGKLRGGYGRAVVGASVKRNCKYCKI